MSMMMMMIYDEGAVLGVNHGHAKACLRSIYMCSVYRKIDG